MMDQNLATKLLERYRNGSCSREEKELVEQWYNQLIETGDWQWGEQEKFELMNTMEGRLLDLINKRAPIVPVHKIHFLRRTTFWAAAAVVIVLLGAGLYTMFLNKQEETQTVAQNSVTPNVPAPEKNKAVVTLSNGQKVYLDDVNTGQIVDQHGAKLVKLATGEIVYQAASGQISKVEYNTLVNPRGSQVTTMTLADGSKVWLNAGSSIKYPVVFVGIERHVEIDGEAYFEIAHNTKMPFKVTKGDMQVEVLGTHFNVKAFDDEKNIKVTLLEGSVNVKFADQSNRLKPGQQAHITSAIEIRNDVDIDKVMAWKNGLFSFEGTSLEEMMREIAKWYDVSVKFEGQIPTRTFSGKIHRTANISEVLKILEESNIRYRFSNKSIVILP